MNKFLEHAVTPFSKCQPQFTHAPTHHCNTVKRMGVFTTERAYIARLQTEHGGCVDDDMRAYEISGIVISSQ